jgi:hypothetical protein
MACQDTGNFVTKEIVPDSVPTVDSIFSVDNKITPGTVVSVCEGGKEANPGKLRFLGGGTSSGFALDVDDYDVRSKISFQSSFCVKISFSKFIML